MESIENIQKEIEQLRSEWFTLKHTNFGHGPTLLKDIERIKEIEQRIESLYKSLETLPTPSIDNLYDE